MSATLRIVRGTVNATTLAGHKVLVDGKVVGMLDGSETAEFPISGTRHLVQLGLGPYHSDAATVTTSDGHVVELKVVMRSAGLSDLGQGGFLHLERTV